MRARYLKDEHESRVAYAVAGLCPNEKGWVRANCPLCETRIGKPDKRRSFGLHVHSLRFECYRCGCSGRLSAGFEEYADVTFETAADAPPLFDPPESYVSLADGDGLTSFMLRPARDYLASRPTVLSREVLRMAQIGACLSGWFADRIIIPVLGEQGEWRWFAGRSWLKTAERKYLYPKGGRAGVLFNHAALLEKTDEPVLVVEGQFDALAHWPHAVAVLGKPNAAHIEALASCHRPVVVALDGDAWDDSWSFANKLKLRGQRAAAIRLAPLVDPDQIPTDELLDAARRSLA